MKSPLKSLFILMIFFISCTSVDTYKDCVNQNYFVNEWHQFQLCYPSNWTEKKFPDFNSVLLFGKRTDSSSFKFNGAFKIGVFKLPKSENIETAYKANMDNLRKDSALNSFKIVNEERIKLDDITTIKTIYSTKVNGIKAISVEYYSVFNNKLLILGGPIPNKEFSAYKNIYSQIAESIDFKNVN